MRKKVALLMAVVMVFSLSDCKDKGSEMSKNRLIEQTEEREAVLEKATENEVANVAGSHEEIK